MNLNGHLHRNLCKSAVTTLQGSPVNSVSIICVDHHPTSIAQPMTAMCRLMAARISKRLALPLRTFLTPSNKAIHWRSFNTSLQPTLREHQCTDNMQALLGPVSPWIFLKPQLRLAGPLMSAGSEDEEVARHQLAKRHQADYLAASRPGR